MPKSVCRVVEGRGGADWTAKSILIRALLIDGWAVSSMGVIKGGGVKANMIIDHCT